MSAACCHRTADHCATGVKITGSVCCPRCTHRGESMTELTEADPRELVGALCPQCSHRAVWHHNERGCQFHGNGPHACPCGVDSDAVVERIIDARLAPIRAVLQEGLDDESLEATGVMERALAALGADLTAAQPTSGIEGQRQRLGERLTRILTEHYPGQGVNPWHLADLLLKETR